MQTVASNSAAEVSEYEKERGKPMPNLIHAILEVRLAIGLNAGAVDRYIVGIEVTLEFLDGLVLTPDITALPKRPIDWRREPAHCRDLPTMVVEILSPSQGYSSAVEKIDAYFARGVQSVWEVNPALKLIAIHQPHRDEPQIIQHGEAKDPVTGLTVRLEDVFA